MKPLKKQKKLRIPCSSIVAYLAHSWYNVYEEKVNAVNYLVNEIKKMQGTVLGIGITDEKLKYAIKSNSNILSFELLEEPKSKIFNPKKFKTEKCKKRQKKVNIKKIRKRYKKKRIDNIICGYKNVSKFAKTFVRDSIYINKGYLYMYGSKEELENIKEKYARYTTDIKLVKEKNIYILVANNSNTKNNKLKDIAYWWKDTVTDVLDFLTILLAN